MKTSHFNNDTGQRSGTQLADVPRLACDSLLWIGDTEHPAIIPTWRECQRLCNTIAIRQTITDALAAPPHQIPSRIAIAQTNRHELGCLAIDGPDLPKLRQQFPDVEMLVLRGPLVAPTVRLPAAASSTLNTELLQTSAAGGLGSPGVIVGAAAPVWVDSVSLAEAPSYLRHWFEGPIGEGRLAVVGSSSDGRSRPATMQSRPRTMKSAPEAKATARSLLPVVVVAARYDFAESLIDSLSLLLSSKEVDEPLIQWQRGLTPRSSRGFATVVWDDSIATPESGCQWRQRREMALHARHVWITGMATPQQRALALAQGVDQVLDKPGRLECLTASLRVA